MGEWAREAGREGADRGRATREQCRGVGQQKSNNWSNLASDEGGGPGRRGGRGQIGGGHQRTMQERKCTGSSEPLA